VESAENLNGDRVARQLGSQRLELTTLELALWSPDRVVGPDAFFPVGNELRMSQSGQMSRGLGLRDAEGLDDVADAQFLVVEQQPEDLKACFIGEELEELGHVSHFHL
jgi:hypothetical protein